MELTGGDALNLSHKVGPICENARVLLWEENTRIFLFFTHENF